MEAVVRESFEVFIVVFINFLHFLLHEKDL